MKKEKGVSLEELIKNPPESLKDKMDRELLTAAEENLSNARKMNLPSYIDYLRKKGMDDEQLNELEFLYKRMTPPEDMPARTFIDLVYPKKKD